MKTRKLTCSKIIIVYLLINFISQSFGQNGNKNIEEFPFQLSNDGDMVIVCTVNDSIKGKFGFDTGGGLHIFSKALSDKVNAQYIKSFTGFQGHGERVDVEVYKVSSLSIGKYKQNSPIITPIEGIEQMGIDGILSLKLFENNAFTIDYAKKKIIIETAKSLQQKVKSGHIVPLKFNIHRDVTIDIFGEFVIYNKQGDSTIVELEIDNGKGYNTILNAKFMDFLGINKNSIRKEKISFRTDTTKSFNMYKCAIKKLSVKNATNVKMENPKIIFQDNLIYDGLIGIRIWENKQITIDIPNKRMIIN